MNLKRFNADIYPYNGMRFRLRWRSVSEDEIQDLCNQLDKLGVRHSKIQKITTTIYNVQVQSKKQIVELMKTLEWKAPTETSQVKLDAIKQYIDSKSIG